ncbi:MAG: RNA polymerase sigma-70 factor [Bacteroidales bacterium]|nr:RNA polymerase sigma-70 factor [Bacteroidales bacterium]
MGFKEEEILRQIRQGKVVAFEKLYKQFSGNLLLYANSLVGRLDIAKDILQDTYIKIWEKRQEIVISTSVKSYLYRSVRNACLDYLKHEQVKSKYVDQSKEALREKEINYLTAYYEYSDDSVNKRRLDETYKAIEKLPEQCRRIFKLSRFEGLKNKEIAEKLQISVRSVDTQIYRALKSIRRSLKHFFNLILFITLTGMIK